ncbi:MAG TPA: hypothetical protein VI895_14910 [Bdellovibrionota bacterium]|nr:hypothetical protein [Bdellovibrionota bacterium]
MTYKKSGIPAFLVLLILTACGSDTGGSVHGVISGQQFELGVQGVNCDAGPPQGPGVPGLDGQLNSPLLCTMNFQSDGYFSDYLAISVSDVLAVHDFLGSYLPIDGVLISGSITLGGQTEAIIQGVVRFTDITNRSGGRVAADGQVLTGRAQVNFEFKDSVRFGF